MLTGNMENESEVAGPEQERLRALAQPVVLAAADGDHE